MVYWVRGRRPRRPQSDTRGWRATEAQTGEQRHTLQRLKPYLVLLLASSRGRVEICIKGADAWVHPGPVRPHARALCGRANRARLLAQLEPDG